MKCAITNVIQQMRACFSYDDNLNRVLSDIPYPIMGSFMHFMSDTLTFMFNVLRNTDNARYLHSMFPKCQNKFPKNHTKNIKNAFRF